MQQIDLRKLALRLKVIEAVRRYAGQRRLREAGVLWRALIQPN